MPSTIEQSAPQPSAPIPAEAAEKLRAVFGFESLRPGQADVVGHLLDDQSAVAIFPTGGGKSLCYQLPALLLDGVTIVVSPLIALMKDQIDFLTSRGVAAARLDSSLTREENFKVYDDLYAGRTKLLYISPERLGNERFATVLARIKIAMLAVDEAHCISQWGHNFRPDYLRIASLASKLNVPRVLALTATATPEVAADIAEAFRIGDEAIINTGFYRQNLNLHAAPCADEDRKRTLVDRIKKREPGPAIVYVTLQRTAEQVAAYLSAAGINAQAYHAGMKTEQRTEIQEEFMGAEDMVVVATIAFGMGIDKADIRAVYHYNLPQGLESYMQEIGRAGRDGGPAHCELLACADDVITLENFSYGDTPTREAIAGLVEEVLGGAGEGDAVEVSQYELSGKHDVRDLVVRTLLTYLELEGVLQPTGAIYTQYKFQPQRSSAEILAKFDPGRAKFIGDMLKHSRRGKTWFTIDVAVAAERMAEPRSRLVAALEYLDQQGDLVLQASGVRHGYRILKQPPSHAELIDGLNDRFLQREDQDIARIRQVIDLVESPGCLWQHVLAHFGEHREPCAHCDRCDGVRAKPLPPTSVSLTDADRAIIAKVAAERQAALAAPRQLTRFLCGIASPAASRAKLRSHSQFGALDRVPFAEVLGVCEEVL